MSKQEISDKNRIITPYGFYSTAEEVVKSVDLSGKVVQGYSMTQGV
jgi:hypothetical protein